MKKNLGGKVVKRAMAVALAVALSAGSVMPAMAVTEPDCVVGVTLPFCVAATVTV